VILKQLGELEELKRAIASRIEEASRSHRYRVDEELVSRVEQTLLRSKQILAVSRDVAAVEEAIPPYRKQALLVKHCSALRE
jgi:hypothetical protein